MKLFAALKSRPIFRWIYFLWIAVGVAIWVGLLKTRNSFIDPYCSSAPEQCQVKDINAFDRHAATIPNGPVKEAANRRSFYTQNASGYYAAAAPFVFHLGRAVLARAHLGVAFSTAITDFVIVLQAVAINGAMNEIVKDSVQRPRPFVYQSVKQQGPVPGNYVSFYSGHTSFAAVTTFSILFLLVGYGVSGWALFLSGAFAGVMTISTGLFRVGAGVHFMSDVICGALAGIVIAYLVSKFSRSRDQ